MNILPLFAGITSLVMSATVMFSRRDRSKYPFIMFAFGMGAWAVLISAFLLSDNSATAEMIARVYYVAAALIFYGFLLFCMSLADSKSSGGLIRASLGLLIPLILVGFIVFMPGYISVFDAGAGAPVVSLNPLYYAGYSVYIISYLVLSYIQIARTLQDKDTSSQKKSQIRMIGFIALICLPFGGLFNLVLPYLGNYELIMLGPLAILPVVGITFYTVKHYGLFDIKLAAVRSVAYVFSLAILALLYYLIAYIISAALFNGESYEVGPASVMIALALAFIFQPVKHFFDQVTDRVFYRNRYDTGEFLIRLGRILTSTTELRVVLERVDQEIRQTLKAGSSLFLVYRDHHPNELVGKGISKQRFSVEDLAHLDAAAALFEGRLLEVDRLSVSGVPEHQAAYEVLAKRHIALALPLVSANEAIGYYMLGEHKLGGYTKQDKGALEAIANELVIAVQNARSIQALRELNANLEHRIDDATKELRKSNEQLREADLAKDEFVSMASHQLRTPLTSIKGYISMVLEGDVGDITPMQSKLLSEAFTSSERMVHLISDFLNVSRLQTGKFMLDPTLTNLADLVDEEVDGLRATAKARSLKLQFRKPSRFPSLYVDGGKIHQVIMNFIDNAIYYSAEGTTIIVRLAVEGGSVVFEVHDTGIGVPKSEQSRLFTKFFRATNARRQRPDGTGIGLFLAKKVIVSHGGSMVFESVEGEGSTFGFRLPIKKLSEPPEPTEPES